MKAEHIADIVASKNAEIAALREALDGVRWGFDRGGMVCTECWHPKAYPEVHAPSCKIGKLFAKGEKL